MNAETTGLDLLAAVERTLAGEVGPALSGDARFKTLMAASALRMVMRELAGAVDLATASETLTTFGSAATLVASIRDGVHDGEANLHAALVADALARTRVSNPARAAASAFNQPAGVIPGGHLADGDTR
ncbi:MAG: DUF6285 domain-containing protein [Bosea sp. (in: a-proteobacteria)]